MGDNKKWICGTINKSNFWEGGKVIVVKCVMFYIIKFHEKSFVKYRRLIEIERAGRGGRNCAFFTQNNLVHLDNNSYFVDK